MGNKLFSAVVFALLLPVGTLSYIIYDGGLRETYWGDVGDLRHLKLNTSLPEGRPIMGIYALDVHPVTRDWCDRQVRKWYPDSVFTSDTPADSREGFLFRNAQNFDESIGFGPSGEIKYFNLSADRRWLPVRQAVIAALSNGDADAPEEYGLMTRDDACEAATEALKAGPGFPDGYFLDAVHVSMIHGLNYSLIDNYIIDFSRLWNGHRVVGDRAYIVITPLGDILDYHVIWRQVRGPLRSERTISATEAALYLDSHLPVWQSGIQPEVRIDHVELGYHFGFWDDLWPETKPVWVFNATVGDNPGHFFYVDALNLELFE